MNLPLCTIGHSTRSLDEFIGLLKGAEIGVLVDVRTVPRSRTNPQFDRDSLPSALEEHGISYRHSAELGGLRSRSKTVSPEVNGFWQNDSFHNYADYALGQEFKAALDELVAAGRTARVAVMCSEAVWWRCHRRIIADWLLARGETVLHIMDRGKLQPAVPTSGSTVRGDGTVTYPVG